jgi:hypothetical protein
MAKRRWAGHIRVDQVGVLHSAVIAHSAVFPPLYLPAKIDRSMRSIETGGARLKHTSGRVADSQHSELIAQRPKKNGK